MKRMTPPGERCLIPQARQLRREATPSKRTLWEGLRGRRLCGVKFRRQRRIGPYIVDFCATWFGLVVDVDASMAEGAKAESIARDEWLEKQGLRVIRFTDEQVERELVSVLGCIEWGLREQMKLFPPDPSSLKPEWDQDDDA